MIINPATIPAHPVKGTEPVVIQTVNGSNRDAVREAMDTRFVSQTERMKTIIEMVHATGAMTRKHPVATAIPFPPSFNLK